MELFDPTFWLAVSFIIFVLLARKPVGNLIAASLDSRAERIRKELDEALRLKEEAQAILAEYERNFKNASFEVESILNNAKEEAERITRNAKENLERDIKRRTDIAEQKIAQAEAAVIRQLRDNAVDITTGAAKVLIMEHLQKEAAEELINAAVMDLGRKLH